VLILGGVCSHLFKPFFVLFLLAEQRCLHVDLVGVLDEFRVREFGVGEFNVYDLAFFGLFCITHGCIVIVLAVWHKSL
jgi:hypothetical protein